MTRAWIEMLLAASSLWPADTRQATASRQAGLPIFIANSVDSSGPPKFELALLAPRSWDSTKVRRVVLYKAAAVAKGAQAPCFTIERASIDRHASYVPLRSGHMTISVGDGAGEWRQYWRLYRQMLRPPGFHIGLGKAPRIGEPVVQAQMAIQLCASGTRTKQNAFDVDTVLFGQSASTSGVRPTADAPAVPR